MKRYLVPGLILLLAAGSLHAAAISVNSTAETVANDGSCTLREAILNANADDQSGSVDCAAGSGSDVINLQTSQIYEYSSAYGTDYGYNALPSISSTITIEANGSTIRRAAAATGAFRLFFVDTTGALTLHNAVLSNGLAKGGNGGQNFGDNGGGGGGGAGLGGAIYNRGTLTIDSSTLTSNIAQGGNGGAGADGLGTDAGGGGGGGGMGGNGGDVLDSNTDGGGGGGGWGGDGGDSAGTSSNIAGGGGGGTVTAGGNSTSCTGGTAGTANGGAGGNCGVTGTAGGTGGGGGGGGDEANGGAGGIGGGGGGTGESDSGTNWVGGAGGFGGGGGGGGEDSSGGNGGFGGGGGGAGGNSTGEVAGLGGWGGGNAGSDAGAPASGGGGGAGMGGALFNDGGTVNLVNATISGNYAVGGTGGTGTIASANGADGEGRGGGIFSLNGTITVSNVTIADNTGSFGGGIELWGNGGTATGQIANSIVANSTATWDCVAGTTNGGSLAISGSYNLVEANLGCTGITVTSDPMLAALALNAPGSTPTHALQSGSPAIDAGNTAASVTTDQRGSARPLDDPAVVNAGDGADIGAYELNAVAAANVTGTKSVSGNFVEGGSVQYTIVLTNNGTAAQGDNTGDEFTDVLPPQLTLVSASATSGTTVATVGTNTVTWNGSIPARGSVTITINATIEAGTGGTSITNQGTISYDSDGNGTNDASNVTDDPLNPAGGADATAFAVAVAVAIPALDGFGLLALAALLAAAAAMVLGVRS